MSFVQFRAIKTNTQFLISLIRENFARNFYFSKIRPTITTVNMTFSSFFGTLCSNRLFPKKYLKFSLKKYLKRRSILFACGIQDNRLKLKIGKSKIEKKVTPSETRQKLKIDVFSLRSQKWILYSFEQSKLTPSF